MSHIDQQFAGAGFASLMTARLHYPVISRISGKM